VKIRESIVWLDDSTRLNFEKVLKIYIIVFWFIEAYSHLITYVDSGELIGVKK